MYFSQHAVVFHRPLYIVVFLSLKIRLRLVRFEHIGGGLKTMRTIKALFFMSLFLQIFCFHVEFYDDFDRMPLKQMKKIIFTF